MPSTVLDPFVLLPLLLAGGYCIFASLARWTRGIQLLVLAILFGGIIGVRLGSGPLPIVFRDVAIVLPLYAAFFASGTGLKAMTELPGDVAIALILVVTWLTACLFNPDSGSGVQLLIGLKVWIFYVPFLLVGVALAQRPAAMFGVFRALLIWGLVACLVGLVQALLVRMIGYTPAIALFFGESGAQVTQGYTHFEGAGGVYRIPGTFSFASQYVGFLHFFLVIAMIESNADPDPRFRRLGLAAFYLCLLAVPVSGTKGALITFPALVLGFALFGLIRNRVLVAAPVAAMVGLWGLSSFGVDVPGLFSFGLSQTQQYTQSFVFEQIGRGLESGFFGHGIGSNTGAARYAAVGADPGLRLGLESYYAKIAAELGWVGLILFVGLFLMILVRSSLIVWRHQGRRTIAIIGPLVVYLLFIIVSSFKGWALDIDPANVFFWLSLGLAIGLDRVVSPELVSATARVGDQAQSGNEWAGATRRPG